MLSASSTRSYQQRVKNNHSMGKQLLQNLNHTHPPPVQITTTFTCFQGLPRELREIIWQLASAHPRIVELDGGLRPATLPPLLLTCYESRKEYHIARGAQIAQHGWIRFDHDIIHLKNLEFSENTQEKLVLDYLSQGQSEEHEMVRTPFNYLAKWVSRPAIFEHIRMLAVSHDLLMQAPEPFEDILTHFFPNLLLLVVLIDMKYDIEAACEIEDNARIPFVEASVASFREVRSSDTNCASAASISKNVKRRFEAREMELYNEYGYITPLTVVMKASPPASTELGAKRLEDELVARMIAHGKRKANKVAWKAQVSKGMKEKGIDTRDGIPSRECRHLLRREFEATRTGMEQQKWSKLSMETRERKAKEPNDKARRARLNALNARHKATQSKSQGFKPAESLDTQKENQPA